MNVKLIKAERVDLETVLQMQHEAFAELLQKYRDYDTNPANETIEKIIFRFCLPETTYYFIMAEQTKVGVIRVVDFADGKSSKRISPIFIMPPYRGRGYAQQAIREAERLHGAENWQLETILQERGNCYLYEKMGYRRTGKTEVINDRLTLVYYEKV